MNFKQINKKKILDILADIGSTLFSSPVVTTLCTVAVVSKLQYLGLILSSICFYILTPIFAYTFLRKKGLITDKNLNFNIVKREERTPYNIILLLAFLTNYILISMYQLPEAKDIALVVLLAFLVMAIVSVFWKISGHMVQTVLAISTLAYIFPSISIYILLIGGLIFVPWVGWSRVYNKHHNIYQVLAGTLTTSLIAFLVFTIA